jgi:hypothetical protein
MSAAAISFGLGIGLSLGMLGGGGSVLAVPVLVYILAVATGVRALHALGGVPADGRTVPDAFVMGTVGTTITLAWAQCRSGQSTLAGRAPARAAGGSARAVDLDHAVWA